MVGYDAEGRGVVKFGSAGGFGGEPIGIGSMQACWMGGFVRIDHEFIIGGFFGDTLEVLGHPLRIVVFAAGDDAAYVTSFDGIDTFGNHVGIGGVHAAFVIGDGAGSFVVHDEAEAFGLCVFSEGIDVVVRIWTGKIEDIFFPVAEPVFPSLVPSFDEDAVEAMLGRKIDVTLHVRGVGAVFSAG